jgi:hypothetical protein
VSATTLTVTQGTDVLGVHPDAVRRLMATGVLRGAALARRTRAVGRSASARRALAPVSDRVKAPAFQWYPGDHRRDTALQACSFEARALWREMLDLMHDGTPYGHLAAGGVPITPAQLARLAGVPPARVTRWLAELEERAVFTRTDAGVIYSRRMVRDEHLRSVRRAAGTKGGNPALLAARSSTSRGDDLVNQTDNQTGKQNLTPAIAVAVASASTATTASTSAESSAVMLKSFRAVHECLSEGASSALGEQFAAFVTRDASPAMLRVMLAACEEALSGADTLTPRELRRAVADYLASGSTPNANLFGGFLRHAVKRPPRATPTGSSHAQRERAQTATARPAPPPKFEQVPEGF